MTTLKQIDANRLNAQRSTGPRTEAGKQRSRQNALRHGLTAETVISALESAADFSAFEAAIVADYQPQNATESELVGRLVSVLWRLRRSTAIETGLFQIHSENLRDGRCQGDGRPVPRPQWHDELDRAPSIEGPSANEEGAEERSLPSDSERTLGYCFLRVARMEHGAFDLLSRYETALWRQATQLLFLLQPALRR